MVRFMRLVFFSVCNLMGELLVVGSILLSGFNYFYLCINYFWFIESVLLASDTTLGLT